MIFVSIIIHAFNLWTKISSVYVNICVGCTEAYRHLFPWPDNRATRKTKLYSTYTFESAYRRVKKKV